MKVIRNAVWIWFGVLLILNVIPLGNDVNKSLSGNEIWGFRFDYLLHSVMILGFAWIEVLKRVLGFSGFGVWKFGVLVMVASIGMELIQLLIPWRSFNPVDLAYNLVGALLGMVAVLMVNGERGRVKSIEN